MQDIFTRELLVGAIRRLCSLLCWSLRITFLIQGPLTAVLAQAPALTEGHGKMPARPWPRRRPKAQEYAERSRQARAAAYKLREQRMKQWTVERDAALDTARQAAGQKVREAQAELEAEAATARAAFQASAADLAGRALRAVLPAAAGGSVETSGSKLEFFACALSGLPWCRPWWR